MQFSNATSSKYSEQMYLIFNLIVYSIFLVVVSTLAKKMMEFESSLAEKFDPISELPDDLAEARVIAEVWPDS